MRIWRTCSPTINAPPIYASASAGGASLCPTHAEPRFRKEIRKLGYGMRNA